MIKYQQLPIKIQGYKEMTDITDETSTSPPVETTQPNTSNESSHD